MAVNATCLHAVDDVSLQQQNTQLTLSKQATTSCSSSSLNDAGNN